MVFLESIIDSIDKGEHSLGIFMDLSNAFDSVQHKVLVNKLHLLGIKGKFLEWLKFLSSLSFILSLFM